MNTTQKPILFFDGVCGLCNGFIDFLLKEDKAGVYLFSPLQGEAAKQYLEETERSQLNSLALWDGQRILRKSSAVLKCLTDIGGFWGLARVLYIVPEGLRDWGYDLIAQNRYRIFGKQDACRIPTEEEKRKFLE